jgi:hypothetical protein
MGGVVFQRLDQGGPFDQRTLNAVLRQSGSTSTWRGTSTFRADTSAAFLEANGYATPDANYWPVLHHPDDQVLFDDSFVRTHCFKPTGRSNGHRGEVGVDFEPSSARAGMTEIRGTVWLDTVGIALQSVEFTYVHSPYEGPGFAPSTGWLRFATASNGVPLLASWSVRRVADYTLSRRNSPGVSTAAPGVSKLASIEQMQEEGGELAFARWDDGVEWHGALPTISGRVIDQHTRQPVGGVLVSLITAGAAVLTDSAGDFRFPYVAPGPHVLEVADTTYSFAAPPRESREASFRGFKETRQFSGADGAALPAIEGFARMVSPAPNQAWIVIGGGSNAPGTIEITSRRERLRETCGEGPGTDTLGVLAGNVTTHGTPATGAAVRARWGDGPNAARATKTNELGWFMICGIPRRGTVSLLTALGNAKPVATSVAMSPARVTSTTVKVSP